MPTLNLIITNKNNMKKNFKYFMEKRKIYHIKRGSPVDSPLQITAHIFMGDLDLDSNLVTANCSILLLRSFLCWLVYMDAATTVLHYEYILILQYICSYPQNVLLCLIRQ